MSITGTGSKIDVQRTATFVSLSRAVIAGACLVTFASFGTFVAIAGDDAGVREFLSRASAEVRPRPMAGRSQSALPSLFVPSASANRLLLGYAPYESRAYDHPRSDSRLAVHAKTSLRLLDQPRKRVVIATDKQRPVDDSRFGTGHAYGSAGVISYCVRLCDGYFFPISRSGASAAELQTSCNGLCPSAQTKLYSAPAGSEGIEQARFRGEAYTRLSTAFLHRIKVSKACTCTAVGYGLETQDTRTDATFKRGDVLVMDDGLRVYRGAEPGHNRARDFVPLQTSTLLTASERRKLSELMVRTMPRGQRDTASSEAIAPPLGLTPLKTQGSAGFDRIRPVGTVSLLRQDGVRSVYPIETQRSN